MVMCSEHWQVAGGNVSRFRSDRERWKQQRAVSVEPRLTRLGSRLYQLGRVGGDSKWQFRVEEKRLGMIWGGASVNGTRGMRSNPKPFQNSIRKYQSSEAMETRRSGNYQASVWDDDYVQSLSSPYSAKVYLEQADELKFQLKKIIDGTKNQLEQLDLISILQRLDISKHFQEQIHKLLDNIYRTVGSQDIYVTKDLYFTSLRFRLLRQHGYHVPQDVFCSFMDEVGNFQACLSDDAKGLLSLYEASFLSVEGETIMDLARDFSAQTLKVLLEESADESQLVEEIRHALELPLHWRVHKLEAKWFIHIYGRRLDANPIFLQLAKLEFNIVQAQYQDEIKYLSRWYKETGLPEKLGFARHRLAECFLSALGFIPEAHLGYSRKIFSKMAVLITIMDDIYDVYGTLDELEMFTETMVRWDINTLDSLAEYQKFCFVALFNSSNEMAYDILRDQGVNVISSLRKLLTDLSRTYHVEARWYHSGYFPSLNEYLSNAWISIAGPVLLLYAYLTITDPIDINELRQLEKYPGIIQWPSMVARLVDDLGTASGEMEKGDVPKSIQCYMRDMGCDEVEAREYIKVLIDGALKRMNSEIVLEKGQGASPALQTTSMNLARIAMLVYQFGDGFGDPHGDTKKNLVSLLVEPIKPMS